MSILSREKTPLLFLGVMALSIPLFELCVMMVLQHSSDTYSQSWIFFDSLLLLFLLTPVLYYFFYKPFSENYMEANALISSMNEGFCLLEIIYNETKGAEDFRILNINPAYIRLTGTAKKMALGSKISDFYGPSEPPYQDILTQVASNGKPAVLEVYFKSFKKHFNVSIFSPSQGKLATIFTDITDKKKAEERLVLAKEEWEEAFDTINDAITIHDNSYNIIRSNKAAEQLLKTPVEKICKEKCYQVYHGKDSPPQRCPSCQSLKTGLPSVSEFFDTHLNKYIKVKALPKFDKKNQVTGTVHIVEDITKLKQLEREKSEVEAHLRQIQKMDALGTLAGGIAHDFNNLLSVIIGYTEIAREETPSNSNYKSDLSQVLSAANKAKDLVKQILTFSRQADNARTPTKLEPLVKSAIKLLQPSVPATIIVEDGLEKEKQTIFADRTQIYQIVMNLCTNAAHALGKGDGIIRIQLSNVEFSSNKVALNLDPGEYIKLTISDTGDGIAPDTIDKIFDPFFTTKDTGTGMGLSITHGIVSDHGGDITVKSELGKGASFDVYLPVYDENKGIATQPQQLLHITQPGAERFLEQFDNNTDNQKMLISKLETTHCIPPEDGAFPDEH